MAGQEKFPNLETERLVLRNVSNEDVDFIYQLFSNEKVCEYLYDEEPFTNKNDAKEFVE